MKKLKLTFVLLLCSYVYTNACINIDNHKLKITRDLFDTFKLGEHPTIDQIKKVSFKLDSLYKKTKNIGFLSDIGVIYIYTKQYQEAIKLYLSIEQIKPNKYSTASNIGTAYELIGDNKNALKWIKKSIQINSNSHLGSEWIHVKILEAKIKGDSFINSQFLINTVFKNGTVPESDLTSKELEELAYQLYFQLEERKTFVKPKDKIVAYLSFELGNIDFIQGYSSASYKNYMTAKKYGFTDSIIDVRIKKLINIATPKIYTEKVYENKWSSLTYYLIGGGGILILLIGYFLKKRLRK